MTIEVGPELQAMIEEKMRAGQRKTVEELLIVGLKMIDFHDRDVDDALDEIGPENLRRMLDEVDRSRPGIPAEEVYARLDARLAALREHEDKVAATAARP